VPVLQNVANGGGTWAEHGVSYDQVMARVGLETKQGCPELWDYFEHGLELAREEGLFTYSATAATAVSTWFAACPKKASQFSRHHDTVFGQLPELRRSRER
jgi:hypothetical protein